ncbi:MAG: TIGR02466 family protein [Rhizobiaceae bacterium]|nr:TIGR02466 family protein [Rhizobiaceae bacterium]
MKIDKDSLTRQLYFPTIIYRFQLPDAEELNDQLLKSIYSEREKDQVGLDKSNLPKLGGWHSQSNMQKSRLYKPLVERVENVCDLISEDLQYHESYHLKVSTMWSIINPPGSSNNSHIHPGCDWSGVYYIQTPEDSGDIRFTDPRTAHLMNQLKFDPEKKRIRPCWTKVRIKPSAGKIVIFPSFLYHSVDTNFSNATGNDANRVIIAFNIVQRQK